MKKQNTNLEYPEVFSEVLEHLESYEIKFPEEPEINRAVKAVRTYMLVQNKRSSTSRRFLDIIRFALNEITFIRPFYWISSIVLYLVGTLFFSLNQNPYFIVLTLAPTPFILGIIEIMRARDENMMELEMSCKFSAANVILSKIFVIGVYNILLNSLLSAWFSMATENVDLIKLTLCWLTPFTVICGWALMISIHFRGNIIVGSMMSIWMIACLSIFSSSELMEKLMPANWFIYVLLIVAGIVFSAFQISQLLKKTNNYFERTVVIEIND